MALSYENNTESNIRGRPTLFTSWEYLRSEYFSEGPRYSTLAKQSVLGGWSKLVWEQSDSSCANVGTCLEWASQEPFVQFARSWFFCNTHSGHVGTWDMQPYPRHSFQIHTTPSARGRQAMPRRAPDSSDIKACRLLGGARVPTGGHSVSHKKDTKNEHRHSASLRPFVSVSELSSPI